METLFVTGGSGLLGSKFIAISDNEYEIITSYHQNPQKNSISLDIRNKKDITMKIVTLNPDAVIHAAALTDVDYCEDHRNEAWNINALGTKNIVKACDEADCKLIYVSTDFVFDGLKGLYRENDKTNPINYYAQTKIKGEEFVQSSNLNYAIARVSVLYGWHRRLNFATWVIKQLKNDEEINVVTDQYNSPTLADNATDALLRIFEKDKKGIYHIAGNERISRFDFAKKIAKVFALNENLINPIKSENFVQRAKRPQDSSLCVEKAQIDLNLKLFNIEEGLEEMKTVKR